MVNFSRLVFGTRIRNGAWTRRTGTWSKDNKIQPKPVVRMTHWK